MWFRELLAAFNQLWQNCFEQCNLVIGESYFARKKTEAGLNHAPNTMGCGKSSLGSDSPKNSQADPDEQELDKVPVVSKPPSPHISPAIPFSAGGPLLAQAKISESQLSFFRMLDEKIENGPDFESEDDDTRHERLKSGLQTWATYLKNRETQPYQKPQLQRLDAIEVDSSFDSDNNNITRTHNEEYPSENTIERYMFMGNLYTLTRLGADGTELIEVTPATIQPFARDKRFKNQKANGSTPHRHLIRPKRLQRTDTPAHQSRPPPRPASLVLKPVFQNDPDET